MENLILPILGVMGGLVGLAMNCNHQPSIWALVSLGNKSLRELQHHEGFRMISLPHLKQVFFARNRLQYFPDWVWLNILEPQTRWLHPSKYTHTHILVCQAETMRRVVQGTLPSNLQDFVAFWAKTVAVCHLQSSHICHIGSLSQFAYDFYEDLEPFHWIQICLARSKQFVGFINGITPIAGWFIITNNLGWS